MAGLVFTAFFIVVFASGTCSGQGDKIFNGDEATPHAYPWSVHLLYPSGGQYYHFCGGSLISRRYVITAAHCDVVPGSDVVYLGDHNYTTTEGTEVTATVKTWIPHPDYDSRTGGNDIALVLLDEAVKLTSSIMTVDILKSSKYHDKLVAKGKTCTLTGWGLTKYYTGWAISDVLQTLSVKLLDGQICSDRGNFVASGAFCYEAAKDFCSGSCSGDSGSGIVARRKGAYVLVGVHAYRMNNYDGCASGVKGAFKVANYASWIDSYIA